MPKIVIFLIALIVIAVIVLRKRDPYALLIAMVALEGIFQADISAGGIRVDTMDVCLLGFFYLYRIKRHAFVPMRVLPGIYLWGLLGILVSIAYCLAPVNQPHLSDPLRIVYQLYRYCWRPILVFPLAMMVVGTDIQKARGLITWVFMMGCYFALLATWQGYHGGQATGPFNTKNALGGALIAPCVCALSYIIAVRQQKQWRYGMLGCLLLLRGVIFARSRGAFVATFAAVGAFLGSLFLSSVGRMRVLRFCAMVAIAIPCIFLLVPDILERPNVRRIFELVQGSDVKNFVWRRELRWPHFMAMARNNFWFGVGTDRDLSLGWEANTPHNGFLSLVLIYGAPAAAIFVLLGLKSVFLGVLTLWRARTPEVKLVCITFASGIFGILTHQFVEGTLAHEFTPAAYWMMTGVTAMACRSRGVVVAEQQQQTTTPRRLALRRAPIRRPRIRGRELQQT